LREELGGEITMAIVSEVLISFFDSKQAAIDALASVESIGRDHSSVLVNRESDGSRPRCEPPVPWPLGAILGLCLGGIVGSWAGEAGLVVGLFSGLYLGIFLDAWRVLGRGDLLDEVQYGLAPGQAAVVSFVSRWSATAIERCLASLGAVTVHRFAGSPIEEDVAREVAEALAEVYRVLGANKEPPQVSESEPALRSAAVRRLRTIEAIAERLLGQERAQFEFDVDILHRELDEAGSWRAMRIKRRMSRVRASYERSRKVLETSRGLVRAAASLLRDRRAALDQLAAEMENKETVSAARLAEIVAETEPRPAQTAPSQLPRAAVEVPS
jgi:hypothetical protein